MKRLGFLTVAGLLAIMMVLSLMGCPKDPPPPPPETPEVVDTTPVVVEEEPPPPPPPPKPILKETQFQTVYFDLDKFALRGDAKAALDANYALLNEFTDAIVKIEGHCDERGTIEYNMSLGEKRAKSVMDYLTGLGVNASRLSVISYGKERPIDNASNEAAWTKNRRAEFKIISQ